jgi:serine/threonine protein kinase
LQEVSLVHRPPGHGGDEAAADVPRGFEVRGELGRGATARVWRAFDRALSREVALKVVEPVAASSALARERFLAEARVLASLRHPNRVRSTRARPRASGSSCAARSRPCTRVASCTAT